MFQIADLHCDLLAYLADVPGSTPYDSEVPCNFHAFEAGNVVMQVLPIYTVTEKGSSHSGMVQVEKYEALEPKLQFLPAIENASGFAEEDEPLGNAFSRLDTIIERIGSPLYLSLTWNEENRFGGGNLSSVGLKPDGKKLLHRIAGQGIALDLSHASDALAHDCIDEIDARALNIPIIASHSNARAVCDVPRNLPDDLIKEIFRRGGVIGLNFYRKFVGESWTDIQAHVDHLLSLGGEKGLCFGADFFHESCVPPERRLLYGDGPFFPELGTSASYPKVLDLLGCDDSLKRGIAYQNLSSFLASVLPRIPT